MSAFLVNDETINRLAARLVDDLKFESWLKSKLEDIVGEGEIDSYNDETNRRSIAKQMFELNCQALTARYGDNEFPKFHYQLEIPGGEIQSLKSLNSWLYQCTEGFVVENEFYKFMNTTYKMYLMTRIIDRLPEYERASWR